MKLVFSIVITLFLVSGSNPITKISDHNTYLKKATKLYENGKFNEALSLFAYVSDTLGYDDPHIKINIANSYFNLDSTSKSYTIYNSLLADPTTTIQIKSQSANQLGNIAQKKSKLEEALSLYKKALKLNPNNLKARYNYELTKKKLTKKNKEKKKKPNQKGDKSKENKEKDKQKNKDDSEKENKSGKDGKDKSKDSKDGKKSKEKKNKKKNQSSKDQKKEKSQEGKNQKGKQDKQNEKLGKPKQIDNLKMSEQRAKMLLEATETETKYIQNMKKRGARDQDNGKPDW